MIGEKVVLRTRMSAGDAHYAGQLVEGAHIVTAWGDVGTELAIRLFGDESLFVGYSEIRFTAPVYSGDWMEYSGWIEKVGNTSFTCHFEAHKVMELADRDGKLGLADSAALVQIFQGIDAGVQHHLLPESFHAGNNFPGRFALIPQAYSIFHQQALTAGGI